MRGGSGMSGDVGVWGWEGVGVGIVGLCRRNVSVVGLGCRSLLEEDL